MDLKRSFALPMLLLLLLLSLNIACSFSLVTTPSATLQAASPTTASPTQTALLTEYRNTEYGFAISLPPSWQNYSITMDIWEGLAQDPVKGDVVVEQGPKISIHHPDSTPQQPRQEIPIMVFTTQQWEAMERDEWHIGAAPIGPTELGRNSRYILALPARYNYAYLEGWEEVEQILQGKPMQTFEPS